MKHADEASPVQGVVRLPPLPLGSETEWGKIEMIGITGGERYYWMCDVSGVVSMIPAFMVEQSNAVLSGRPGKNETEEKK